MTTAGMADSRAQIAAPSRVAELARAAYDAGFRGAALVRAVAVQLLESAGEPGATAQVSNPAPGFAPEYSVGTAQINLLAHGNRISMAQARDIPTANRYMKVLYDEAGGTFGRDWVQADAALNGSGPPELVARARIATHQATAAVAAVAVGEVGSTTTPDTHNISSSNPIPGADFFAQAGETLTTITARGFWPRVGLTAAALALIVFGGAIYFRKEEAAAVQTVAGVASKAA